MDAKDVPRGLQHQELYAVEERRLVEEAGAHTRLCGEPLFAWCGRAPEVMVQEQESASGVNLSL